MNKLSIWSKISIKSILAILASACVSALSGLMEYRLKTAMVMQQMSIHGGRVYYDAYERWVLIHKSALIIIAIVFTGSVVVDIIKHLETRKGDF